RLSRACLLPSRERGEPHVWGRAVGRMRGNSQGRGDRRPPHPPLRGTFSREGRRHARPHPACNSNASCRKSNRDLTPTSASRPPAMRPPESRSLWMGRKNQACFLILGKARLSDGPHPMRAIAGPEPNLEPEPPPFHDYQRAVEVLEPDPSTAPARDAPFF